MINQDQSSDQQKATQSVISLEEACENENPATAAAVKDLLKQIPQYNDFPELYGHRFSADQFSTNPAGRQARKAHQQTMIKTHIRQIMASPNSDKLLDDIFTLTALHGKSSLLEMLQQEIPEVAGIITANKEVSKLLRNPNRLEMEKRSTPFFMEIGNIDAAEVEMAIGLYKDTYIEYLRLAESIGMDARGLDQLDDFLEFYEDRFNW